MKLQHLKGAYKWRKFRVSYAKINEHQDFLWIQCYTVYSHHPRNDQIFEKLGSFFFDCFEKTRRCQTFSLCTHCFTIISNALKKYFLFFSIFDIFFHHFCTWTIVYRVWFDMLVSTGTGFNMPKYHDHIQKWSKIYWKHEISTKYFLAHWKLYLIHVCIRKSSDTF